MIPKLNPRDASDVLKNGGTAIYPTEGIYGLGCDPCLLYTSPSPRD